MLSLDAPRRDCCVGDDCEADDEVDGAEGRHKVVAVACWPELHGTAAVVASPAGKAVVAEGRDSSHCGDGGAAEVGSPVGLNGENDQPIYGVGAVVPG